VGDFVSVGGHQGGKTAKNGLGTTNNSVTSGTMSANASHSHLPPTDGGTNRFLVNGGGGDAANLLINGTAYVQKSSTASTDTNHTHSITSNVTIAGDNETRPMNRGVRYIIKV